MEPEPNKKLTVGEIFAMLLFGIPLGAIVLVGIGYVVGEMF